MLRVKLVGKDKEAERTNKTNKNNKKYRKEDGARPRSLPRKSNAPRIKLL